MSNQKFVNACERKPQDTPPVWMMRQAGRYHKHYQQLRRQHSFMDLCKNPNLAAEVALGPVADFDFDVSILFSDLLFPLEALGMGLDYDPAPRLGWHLLQASDFTRMRRPDQAVQELLFQGEAVSATRKVLPNDKSLIGFVGSPWTLFVYAVAGSHKDSLIELKKRIGLYPRFAEIMVPLLIENIKIQLDAGAERVMIFDTAAGELASQDFNQMVAPDLNQLTATFPNRLGYYAKHTVPAHLQQLKGFAGFGYDHRWSMAERLQSQDQGFVQGNFDQSYLFLQPDEFEAQFRQYLKPLQAMNAEQRAGWVCGLGHGVLPATPEENVRSFVKILRESF
jgi:uroporphyrinogen decarboxylase